MLLLPLRGKKTVQPWQQAALLCSFYHREERHSHVRTCQVFSGIRHNWPFCKAAVCCHCRCANYCLLDPRNRVTFSTLNCRQRSCFVGTKCLFFPGVLSWFQETTFLNSLPIFCNIPRATMRRLCRVHLVTEIGSGVLLLSLIYMPPAR